MRMKFYEDEIMDKRSNSYHVVPGEKGGWVVIRAKALRAFRRFDTKSEAIKEARKVSRKQKTELVIHGKDGKIQRKDSHGHDPLPPRG